MWRNKVRRGRAGQAFELAEPRRGRRGHRRFLAADRRGPLQDDQAVKTKLLPGSCLRILDQGLGSTRARSSRNQPLEPLCTMAERTQGWAGHPCHTRRMRLTSTGTPAPDVDALRLVTRWASRQCSSGVTSLAPLQGRAARSSSAHRTRPWPQCRSRQGWSAVFTKPNSVINTKGRAFRRLATISNDLRAALVDEPMAQLHECAPPLLRLRSSGYRPGTSEQAGRAGK
jgi:hypothetical protein